MTQERKLELPVIINDKETDYTVTDSGIIYSNKFNRRIKLKYNTIRGGYKMAYFYVNGKKYSILVARVVATAFLSNPDNKPQVNHEDGNKENNCVSNLKWVTQSENIKHAYDNKLMKKTYKDCYNAKLDACDVRNVRIALANGDKQRDIAKQFNVNEQIISSIKHGRSYRGIGLIK